MARSNSEVADRRREHWRELMERWRAGGLSQAEFCRRRGIPAWKFTWWKKRLGAEGAVAQGLRMTRRRTPNRVGRRRGMDRGAAFVPVQVVAAPSAGDLELTLRGGRVLRFGADVEAARLTAIVAALEAACSEGRSC